MSSLHRVLNCEVFYIYICCFMVVGSGLSCKPITLTLYSNFQIFVAMATRVCPSQMWLAYSWIGRPRKPYHITKNYDSIVYTTEVMANFLVKFPIFRYHGNRGRLSKVWLTPLNCRYRKPPSMCKNLGRISCTSWVIADFLLKIANFRYHGNKSMSEPSVTGIVELADPENHTIEPKITTLSYIQPKLWLISR